MPALAAADASFTSRHARARAQKKTLDRDLLKTFAEADHDAFNAAVAHQNVGASAKHQNRNRGIEPGKKISKIALVGGLEQHLRRTSRPEPGQAGHRRMARERSA